MKRRSAPEEYHDSGGPLFAHVDVARARQKARAGAESAAQRAEYVQPGWKAEALEAVRLYALEHERFLIEQVGIGVPSDADPRAAGQVAQEAKRRGWIRADGYGSALSSNGSAKVAWKSLIFPRRSA